MATSTRSFGTSRRENHDASSFYARRLATASFSDDTEVADIPRRNLDRIYHHTSEDMAELPDNSVALMVTSPPYHAGKDYDSDVPYAEFLALLHRVFAEVHRVLEPGGRAAVNVANLGRKPYLPLSDDVTAIMSELGFHMRGEVIWRTARGMAGSCAFGTFASARNPVLRDVHEYVCSPRAAWTGCARATAPSPRRSSWPPRRRCGNSRPSRPGASAIRRRSRWRSPGASSSCTPSPETWCSTPSAAAGPPRWPRCSPAGTSWATTARRLRLPGQGGQGGRGSGGQQPGPERLGRAILGGLVAQDGGHEVEVAPRPSSGPAAEQMPLSWSATSSP